jgi:UDP-glucose 4-epimerase
VRVLVTGGAGVIGSHLVERLLAEECEVSVVDDLSTGRLHYLQEARRGPSRLGFQRLDVISNALERAVAKARPDVVCHLASRAQPVGSEDPVADTMTEVVGTARVLEACAAHGVGKLVFATHLDDRHLPAPSSFVAAKRGAEQLLRSWGHTHGLRWTVLALARVVGPRQDPADPRHLEARVADWMLESAPVTLAGGPARAADLLAVEDAVDAFVRALSRGDGERIEIGSGTATSQGEVVTALAQLTAWAGEPAWLASDPPPAPRLADIEAAARALGWAPRVPTADALARLVGWLRG